MFLKRAPPAASHDADLIELNSCGIVSRFRYPKFKTRCLNIHCGKAFKTREATIEHYRTAHSKAAIYCELCKKPVHTISIAYWKSHCEKKHPQMKSNAVAGSSTIDTSPTVSKSSASKSQSPNSEQSQPANSKHSSKSMTKTDCPLNGCNYRTRQMSKLRKHWTKMHGYLRFPIVHETQSNDVPDNDPAPNSDEQTNEVSKI